MADREWFQLRRQSDDLVYTFRRRQDPGGDPAYQRQDQDFWITFRPDLGWVAWDHPTQQCMGKPWDVPPDKQENFPPEGVWVSRKGAKSYVYELVYISGPLGHDLIGASSEPTNWLDESIHLSDWNPSWPADARALMAEFVSFLGPEIRIEHIGSTAVDGMPAKPLLDLMIGADDESEQEKVARKLSEMGWQDMGEAGVAGRRHLRKRSGEHANAHIVLFGSVHWRNNLAIRDFLRAHPDERAAYAALKQATVASGADRLLAYSDRKAQFMVELLARAVAWRTTEAKGK